jgi:hypothetical protein
MQAGLRPLATTKAASINRKKINPSFGLQENRKQKTK